MSNKEFIEGFNHLSSLDNTDECIVFIMRHIIDCIAYARLEKIDEILDVVEPINEDIAVAFLSASFMVKGMLRNRNKFYNKAEDMLVQTIGAKETAEALYGLK